MSAAPDFAAPSGIYFSLRHPHIVTVTQWQKSSFTREPPKTKAELRQMLTEAVRNTQPSAENGSKRPKAKNDRYGQGRPPWPYLFEQDHARLSGLRRILWHGRNHRAHRRLLPARSSRSGRAQADSLSAGAGGRWKIVAGGAAEIVDGSPSHLRAEGRRRTQSSVREPPEFVRSGIAGADD